MAKPTALNWAQGDPSYIIEPTAGQKNTGWVAGQKPPNQFFNWIHYTTGKWVDYFVGKTEAIYPTLMRSAGVLNWDGATITFASPIQVSFRVTTGEQINQLAGGSLALSDGQVVVLVKDKANASPVSITHGTYPGLTDAQYDIVSEASLSAANQENETVLFRRKGTDLEIVQQGIIIKSPSYFYLGRPNDDLALAYSNKITTTDATVTKIVGVDVADGDAYAFEALVSCQKSDGSSRGAWKVFGSCYRSGGNVTLNGIASQTYAEASDSAFDVDFVANTGTQQMELKVTGKAGTTVHWTASVKALKTT